MLTHDPGTMRARIDAPCTHCLRHSDPIHAMKALTHDPGTMRARLQLAQAQRLQLARQRSCGGAARRAVRVRVAAWTRSNFD
jgi:hypothetical protein